MYIKLVLKLLTLIGVFAFSSSLYAATQFRVIVDASGSMVISDPDKLTSESLRLIADLAPEKETSLGIWLFGEEPRVLLPDAAVTPEHRQKLASYVDSYVTSDLKTDLEAILDVLLKDEITGQKESEKHWILVTDGMVDISLEDEINGTSRERIKGELLDELVKREVYLHTISMTGHTDKKLLKALSSKTNATHTEVAFPEDLLTAFNKIFSLSSDSDQIPFEGNSFFIDESIDEFTLLVFHAPNEKFRLFDAKGRMNLSNSKQVKSENREYYSLVTVVDPIVGTWNVDNVNTGKSTIRVITDLSAKANSIPTVLFQNESFFSEIGLYQDNELIQDQAFLDVIQVSKSLNKKNGEVIDSISQLDDIPQLDFKYKNTFDGLLSEGGYELVSFVDGGSFTRKVVQHISVVSPIELELKVSGVGIMSYSVKPTNLRLDILNSRLVLEVTSSEGVVTESELPVVAQGHWEKVDFDPEKIFSVRVRLDAVTQSGGRFTYWSNYWDVDRTQAVAEIVERLDKLGNKVSIAQFELDSQDAVPVFTSSSLEVSEVLDESGSEGADFGDSTLNISVDPSFEETADRIFQNVSDWQEEIVTERDVWFYVLINLGAAFIFATVYFLYRRMKRDVAANVMSESD
ncbi:VWA domain-containing protein [Marinomonas sp. 2405UD68-3]|uniref:VWA domain-containing protein n=1 Tax=Marinomonas sp. 2405UD68-3 TaxID=3391835 RepID=UPI0039C95700